MLRVVNIILSLAIVGLAYLLYRSIDGHVKVQKKIEARNQAVYDQLYALRDAQDAFKEVTGVYADNYDTLKTVLLTGNFELENPVTKKITTISLLDSLYKGDRSKVNDLLVIPNSDGKKFTMGAGVLESPSDSTVLLPVFEAFTYNEEYLEGLSRNFWKPGDKVKIGSLTAPITKGNWE